MAGEGVAPEDKLAATVTADSGRGDSKPNTGLAVGLSVGGAALVAAATGVTYYLKATGALAGLQALFSSPAGQPFARLNI
jgi:hypothetical protein